MARRKKRRSTRGSRRDAEDSPRSRKKGRKKGGKRKRSSGFKYKRRSKENWQKRSEQSGYNRRSMFKSEVTVWRPKEGDNLVRILPPTWDDAEHYGYELWCHYGIGPDNDSFLDLNKHLGNPDPIEEERVRALQDNDKEYADKLSSKKRVAVYIVDRDEPEKGVQVWPMPWTMDADITTLAVDKRTGEVLNIDDPEEGYDIEFTKTGKGIKTQYGGVQIARRSSPLDDDAALEAAVELPIPETLVFYDYDEIKKAFGAAGSAYDDDDEDEDDEDEDRRGSRRSRKSSGGGKRRRSGRKYEDDEDDEDEEDYEDDEDEDDQEERSDVSYEQVMDMDIDDLFDLIDDNELDVEDDIDEDDEDEVDDLRSEVCKELGLSAPKKRRAKRSERKKLRRRGRRR